MFIKINPMLQDLKSIKEEKLHKKLKVSNSQSNVKRIKLNSDWRVSLSSNYFEKNKGTH